MKMRPVRNIIISGLALIICASCSFGGDDDEHDFKTNWLGSLMNYQKVSGTPDTGIFLLQGPPGPAAGRILLQPPEITVSNLSDLNVVTPSAYEEVRKMFSSALATEMSNKITPPASGAGATYMVRIALTNITARRVGKPDALTTLKDLQFVFDNASIEAELRERKTNIRRAVIFLNARAPATGAADLPKIFADFSAQMVGQVLAAKAEITNRSKRQKPATGKPKR